MTEYTPKKVAELIAEAREKGRNNIRGVVTLTPRLADALAAVSAERDAALDASNTYRQRAVQMASERDRLHKAITEALAERMNLEADYILRAALDKEGKTDE